MDEADKSPGVREIEGCVKYLEGLINAKRPEERRGKVINFYPLTSEGRPWGTYERVKELYCPANPPPFDEVWPLCGGNPRCPERVTQLGLDVERCLRGLLRCGSRVWPVFVEVVRRGLGRRRGWRRRWTS